MPTAAGTLPDMFFLSDKVLRVPSKLYNVALSVKNPGMLSITTPWHYHVHYIPSIKQTIPRMRPYKKDSSFVGKPSNKWLNPCLIPSSCNSIHTNLCCPTRLQVFPQDFCWIIFHLWEPFSTKGLKAISLTLYMHRNPGNRKHLD